MNDQTFLLFLGPQGSGKGTQVALLNEQLHLPILTMGEVFREESTHPTERGQRVKAIVDAGDIVPPDLWEPVLRDYLSTFQAPRGALFDGIVRSMEQVKPFNEIRQELGFSEPFVVNITLPREESIKRLLLRGRHDDTREAIKQRLEWSNQQTEPVIAYYRDKGRVIDINGDQTIEAVHAEIVEKLKEKGLFTRELT